MPASVIAPDTFDDEWFGQLSDREMLVWIGVFGRLRDDQGRFVENAALARARLFPYRDVPVSDIQDALDRFVRDGRLHRYTCGKVTVLQIVNWWRHQHMRWAAPSAIQAPEGWIDRVRTRQNGTYHTVNWDSCGGFVQDPHTNGSYERSHEASYGPFVLAHEPEPEPEPEPVLNPLADASAPADADDDVGTAESAHFLTRTADYYTADFAEWWTAYGRIGSKADAERLYRFWRAKGAEAADLLAAARVYRAHCECTDCKMQHARTFLAKPPKGGRARWYEWAAGEEHGAMDVRATERLADVFDTAAEAFGLNGGRDDNGSRRQLTGGPTRASQRRAHAGGGVPAGELEAGE